MTETKEPADKTGAAGRASKPGTLRMQKTESAGHVKQSFSHGRVKSVVVEKKTAGPLALPRDEPHSGGLWIHDVYLVFSPKARDENDVL